MSQTKGLQCRNPTTNVINTYNRRKFTVSTNKNKTFLVQGTFVVKANNKADAELAIRRVRVPETTVISSNVDVRNIPAAYASRYST